MRFKKTAITLLVILAITVCALIAVSCKPTYDPKHEIPGITANAVMNIKKNRLNFALGMTDIDEAEIISQCDITLKSGDTEVKVTKQHIIDGAVEHEHFDLGSVGLNKQITVKYKDSSNVIFYDVAEYKVNFYTDKEQTKLWKSVPAQASLTKDLDLSVWINLETHNYSVDEEARKTDAHNAIRFNGWRDGSGEPVTGNHSLSGLASGNVRELDLYAEYLSESEFAAMDLSYDDYGRRVFSGYNGGAVETLSVPEGVTYVDLHEVFYSSPNVTDIKFKKLSIPSTAKLSLPLQRRVNTVGLESVSVNEGNPYYASYAGALYSKNFKTLYLMPASSADAQPKFHNDVQVFARYSCAYWQIKEFALPVGVTTLSDYCFAYSELLDVKGWESVQNVGEGIFWESRYPMISENGGYYTALSDGSYSLSRVENKNIETFKVKDGTTSIAGDAFNGCKNLLSVDLGNVLENIGNSAFSGCVSLVKITLPKTVKNIGDSAFYGCKSLVTVEGFENVVFSENESKKYCVPYGLFSGCSSLKNITLPKNLTRIGDSVFKDCVALSELNIPDCVTAIGSGAFYNCGILSVKLPSELTVLGDNVFYCASLESVDFSDCTKLTKLPSRCFQETKLTSVTLPSAITEIPEFCFYLVQTLESVSLENVSSIGERAFAYCTSLKNVDWGTSLTYLGERAFTSCYALGEIVLPDSLVSVGAYAFQSCSSLKKIKLGKKVQVFGKYSMESDGVNFKDVQPPLYQCRKVEEILVDEENPYFTSIDGILYGTSVCGTKYGDASVLYSAPAAYKRSGEITLPSSVRVILPYAFQYQSGLADITLSDGVENIGKAAFYLSSSLQKLTVPATVTNIGANILLDCSSLTEFTLLSSESSKYKQDGDLVYDGNTLVMASGLSDSVAIKDGIEKINDGVFMNNKKLKSVYIPDSVIAIGNNAFKGCSNLTDITVGKTESMLKDLNPTAFSALESLERITFAASKYFKVVNNILYSSDGKKLVLCPAQHGLTRLTIESSVTEIGDYAFAYNATLTEVVLPEGVKNIGAYAFYECRKVEKFYSSKSLETIGDYSFSFAKKAFANAPSTDTRYCDALKYVVLFGNLKTVGKYAFYGQYGIQSTYFAMTETEVSVFLAKNPNDVATNISYLLAGCPIASSGGYYNNDGEKIKLFLLSEEVPEYSAPNGYAWFHFDNEGNPVAWPQKQS